MNYYFSKLWFPWIFLALLVLAVPTGTQAIDCTGALATTGTFFQNYEQVEYVDDPAGSGVKFLILRFKINASSTSRTIEGEWRVKNDECDLGNSLAGDRDWFIPLPRGATDFSIRFTSPTHYDIWNDASNTPLATCLGLFPERQGCSRNLPDYPAYYTFGWMAFIDIGPLHVIQTSFHPILLPAPSAPVLTETLPVPETCASRAYQFVGGYFFDDYERAEYVGGLLRAHYRLHSPYNDGRAWKARVRTHDALCVPNISTFPPSNNASTTPHIRYFSIRLTTPTHWEIWNDEANTKEICTLCQGDIASTTSYISLMGTIGAGTNRFHGTPYPPVEPNKGNSSVVFIPGIEASRLYKPNTFGIDKLWEPTVGSDDLRQLRLDEQGRSLDPGIYVGDIIDEAPEGFIAAGNIYKSFIAMMDSLVANDTINEWQALPYDWRFDYNDILTAGTNIGGTDIKKMRDEVLRLAESAQNGKVTIIAHSHGGLLAKALVKRLQDEGKQNLLHKLILIAVPQSGTPEAVAGLLHGDNSFGFPGNMVITRPLFRVLAEHAQSAFNLLPTNAYFTRVADPVVEFSTSSPLTQIVDWRVRYGDTINDNATLRSFLAGSDGRAKPSENDVESPNVLLLNFLDKFAINASFQDAWQAPQNLEVIQIAGWGLETLRGIEYSDREETVCNENLSVCAKQKVLDQRPLTTTDGDKTVISYSADQMATTTWYVDLDANNIFTKINRDHADILEVNDVEPLLRTIILSQDIELGDIIYTQKPIDPKVKNRLSVHSPVSIDIYDSDGNHTGLIPKPDPNNALPYLEEDIPNSRYYEFGEGKYVSVPEENGPYNMVIKGAGIGTFTLESEEGISGNYSGGPIFSDIPVSEQSVATLTVDENPPTLTLDIDGNGNIDVTLGEGEEISPESLLDMLEYQLGNLDLDPKLIKKFDKEITKARKHLGKKKLINATKRLDSLTKLIQKSVKKSKMTLEGGTQLMQLIAQIKSSIQ